MSPCVFISYSHESDEHRARVLELAHSLRDQGLDVRFDRYEKAPAEGWPRWARREIEEAEFVICVCTEVYRRAFEGYGVREGRLGVNAEGHQITQELYLAGHRSEKYVPVLFDDETVRAVPIDLQGFRRYRLPDDWDSLSSRLCRFADELKEGRRAPSPTPKPRSEGNLESDAITEHLEPDSLPLDVLAPTDGLFLSRYIPGATPETPSTIWLAARGPLQYVVDCISIRFIALYGLGPTPIVAVQPDAAYSFTYDENCDRTEALVPALSVGPETRRRASFTLDVTPDGLFYHLGDLHVAVHYHTSDGQNGTLLMMSPPEPAVRLARLLRADIGYGLVNDFVPRRELIVTEFGTQRGLEADRLPAMRFEPILFPSRFEMDPSHDHDRSSFRDRLRARGEAAGEVIRRRRVVHRALDKETRATLARWMSDGEIWAADLLGGLGTSEAGKVLRDRLDETPEDEAAVHGLSVHHLVTGGDLLADFVLEHWSDLEHDHQRWDRYGPAIAALFMNPTKSLVEVASLCRGGRPATGWVLTALAGDLTPDERERLLSSKLGPYDVAIYLRGNMNDWVDPPDEGSRLAYRGEGVFEGVLELEPGHHQLKIADAAWKDCNCGAGPTARIVIGKPVALVNDALSSNLELELDVGGHYRFHLDAAEPVTPVLTVEGPEDLPRVD